MAAGGRFMDEKKVKNIDIAIIGISCLFPGADNANEYWNNIVSGEDSISEIGFEKWKEDFYSSDIDEKNKCNTKWLGEISHPECFDNDFFNITPMEANNMDPYQRLLLQETWKSIEDSAVPLRELQKNNTAVVIGSAIVDGFSNGNMSELEINRYTISGSYPFVIPNRISNFFGFSGESKIVDVACSSSSVALGDAVKEIQLNRSKYAIAGGINILRSPYILKTMSKMGLFSKAGKCMTFDADADGIVIGEGIVTLLLTTLEEAEKNNNHIYGVIKNVTVNHLSNTGKLVAPSIASQYDMIKKSWSSLDFDPSTITYAETHGTGTRLGDPIEVEALRNAYTDASAKKNSCYLGSVKANIGHLLGCSGLAGVIKVLKMFENECIPPQINLNNINPLIDIADSPFRIETEKQPWMQSDENTPLRATVTSIGITGVNTYIVLEKYNSNKKAKAEYDVKIDSKKFFMLSAKTKESLNNIIDIWKNDDSYIEKNSFEDIIYSLTVTREQFEKRIIFEVNDRKDLKEKIAKIDSYQIFSCENNLKKVNISWIFESIGTEDIVSRNTAMNSRFNALLKAYNVQDDHIKKFLYKYVLADTVCSSLAHYDRICIDDLRDMVYALLIVKAVELDEVIEDFDRMYEKRIIQDLSCLNSIEYSEQSLNEKVIDEKYIYSLCGSMNFTFVDSVANEYKWHMQIKKLYNTQRMFKKYVNDYSEKIINKYDFDIDKFINDENFKLSDLADDRERLIVAVVLSIARNKLYAKWSLPYKDFFADSRIEKICKLVSEGVIELSYLLDNAGRKFISDNAVESKYSIGELIALCEKNIGTYSNEHSNLLPDNEIACFEDIMSELWKKGLSVDWSSFLVFGDCKGVSLPVYSFEKKKFKMIIQGNYNGIALESASSGNEGSHTLIKRKVFCQKELDTKIAKNNSLPIVITNCLDDRLNINAVKKLMLNFHDDYDFCSAEGESMFHGIESYLSNNNNIIVYIDSDEELSQETYIKYTYMLAVNLAKFLTKAIGNNPVNAVFVYIGQGWEVYCKALAALFKTIKLECAFLSFRTVFFEKSSQDAIQEKIISESSISANADYCVQYRNDKRLVASFEDFTPSKSNNNYIKEDGVYVVFGGCGGIGRQLVKHLASKNNNITIIICGRKEKTDEIGKFINEIKNSGCSIIYMRLDITCRDELEQFFDYLQLKYSNINGIFNLAAILSQGFFEEKDNKYLREAIKTKVDATAFIDEITKDIRLDFLCNFSSISSVIGDYGLAEYTYANNYLDDFAQYREKLAEAGKRYGNTVSINWPFWLDGGMSLNGHELERFKNTTGIEAIKTGEAMKLLDQILGCRVSGQFCIACGNYSKYTEYINNQCMISGYSNEADRSCIKTCEMSVEDIIRLYFSEILSKELNICSKDYDINEKFENYGIDSILIHKINRIISQDIPEISTTLFYDYTCLADVIEHIAGQYDEAFIRQRIGLNLVENPSGYGSGGYEVNNKFIEYFVDILSGELGISPKDYDIEKSFEEYCIDSILIHKINRRITKDFPEISTTLFYDYKCLRELVDCVERDYGNYAFKIQAAEKKNDVMNEYVEQRIENICIKPVEHNDFENSIAVIGMSGKFPGSDNIYQFWDNLIKGKDCITEIPKSRWDIDEYYDSDSKNSFNGKINSRWGGFVEGVDWFDPYLFKITPADAKGMDPQERMLLEIVYEALEYSGYSKKRISEQVDSNIGVFVGSTINGYRLLIEDECMKGNYVSHNALPWSLANRISYCFELNGPSYTIDSACSSSLNAVVAACQNLKAGTCKMAIAGGVNLHIHPSEYITRSQLRVMSTTGKCYAFGENADGYVPGEGIGAIILKPLADAKKDNDVILGVIKGVGTNHVGHPSGYTVPSAKAQSQVIYNALTDAGISAGDVSLIEAHGTGTKLGDPIEINGLTEAFKKFTDEKQYCAISSVKSNIGHLEGAAGIAAVMKVILQMNYKCKVPSINCDVINSGIHFENTPFYVQRNTEKWKNENKALIAGISSFGAGGSNAHIVIENYDNVIKKDNPSATSFPVIFSAMSKKSLIEYAHRILSWLDENHRKMDSSNPFDQKCNIEDIAFTSQVGRELLPYRLGFMVNSLEALIDGIDKFINNKTDSDIIISYPEERQKIGRAEMHSIKNRIVFSSEKSEIYKILKWAIQGIDINWTEYNQKYQNGRIVFLPTYCFDNDRYWIDIIDKTAGYNGDQYKKLSLYLDRNISNVYCQRFVKTFSPHEKCIRDHQLSGEKVLSGMIQLEMALESGANSFESIAGIKSFELIRAVKIKEADIKLEVLIYNKNDSWVFEINEIISEEYRELCSKGKYIFEVDDKTEEMEINCSDMQEIDAKAYYRSLNEYGFQFGESFRTIQKLYVDNEQTLGIINSAFEEPDGTDYITDPQQMDGALQTVFAFLKRTFEDRQTFMPVHIGEIIVQRRCFGDAIAFSRFSSHSMMDTSELSFDINIYNELGEKIAEVREYTLVKITN
jgi:acyl transferase domain-containing protein